MRGPLLIRTPLTVGIVVGLMAAVLSIYVAGHHFIPQEVLIEDDVQATNWGPLGLTFGFFSWIGDAKGFFVEAGILVAILVLNRGAWLFAAGAALSGGLYVAVSHLIVRARPTAPPVLHVYEHPGASSYPSGHSMFIVTLTVVLMLCLGYRYLPLRLRPLGWAIVGLIVLANGIARIYTGAHWPSDVVGGVLIAAAWLAILASVRPVSARIFSPERPLRVEDAVRIARDGHQPKARERIDRRDVAD